MTSITNNNNIFDFNDRSFPTIKAADLIEAKNRLSLKINPSVELTNKIPVASGKQRRALKNEQRKKLTTEFLANAVFSFNNAYETKSNSRIKAFELLSNKEENAKRLVKTKMCRNMVEKGKCNRNICNFAHSATELNDPPCAFGRGCRRKNVCKFKHPEESSEAYRERCNIVVPQIPVPTSTDEDKEDNTSQVPQSSPEADTVIRVPQELAEQAIIKAIESGVKNIRVEIV